VNAFLFLHNFFDFTNYYYIDNDSNRFKINKYDNDNKIIESEHHGINKIDNKSKSDSIEHTLITEKYFYNNGLLNIMITECDNGNLSFKKEYIWDNNNNQIDIMEYDIDNYLYKIIRIEYDDYNNIIKKTNHLIGEFPKTIIEYIYSK
jgi:hypothetical protein